MRCAVEHLPGPTPPPGDLRHRSRRNPCPILEKFIRKTEEYSDYNLNFVLYVLSTGIVDFIFKTYSNNEQFLFAGVPAAPDDDAGVGFNRDVCGFRKLVFQSVAL